MPPLQVRLHPARFDPLTSLAAWECQGPVSTSAAAHFIGRVRASSAGGQPLEALELEHYPGMTERQLERLAADCGERHGVAAVLVEHRIGLVLPGDAIVLVAVAADRRGPRPSPVDRRGRPAGLWRHARRPDRRDRPRRLHQDREQGKDEPALHHRAGLIQAPLPR